MEWMRAHPLISTVCAAGALLALGVFIVLRQSPASIRSQPTAWGGEAIPLLNPTSHAGTVATPQEGDNIMQNVISSAPYTYTPPTVSEGAGEGASPEAGDSFDFDAFVAMLSSTRANGGGTQQPATGGGATSAINAYAYIPTGLFSTTTQQDSRTEDQQKLYDYGNELGSYVQSFEDQNPAQPQILKDQAEDRADEGKAARVVALARGYEELGRGILSIENVPAQMASAHNALAQSYIEVGQRLAAIPKAASDADFLKAIEAYNTAADTFTTNYIRVATLFGSRGIVFTPTDAGSVFTFSSAGGF